MNDDMIPPGNLESLSGGEVALLKTSASPLDHDQRPTNLEISETRFKHWSELFLHFFVGQGLVQIISLGTGFLLIRWMTVTSYAEYSVAFAFQSTLNILVDLGFSGCIVALVGNRTEDRAVIGTYIKSARHHRTQFFFVIGLGSAIVFPLVVKNQPWPLWIKAILWLAVVTGVWFDGYMMYSAPLLIHRRLKDYYKANTLASMVRLVIVGALHVFGGLVGVVAAWFASLQSAIKGWRYRRDSRDLIIEPASHDPGASKEMAKYLAPLWPEMIFYAFQGQIMVGIIAYFGKTQNIAEVAALGRLGQIFVLFGALNGAVLQPLFAKSSGRKLIKISLLAIVGYLGVACLIVLSSVVVPGPWLWLLGPRYSSLQADLTWALAGSSVSLVIGPFYNLIVAKKWVYWSTSVAIIVLVLTVEILGVSLTDLNSTLAVIKLGVASASCSLGVFAFVSLKGLLREHAQGLNLKSR